MFIRQLKNRFWPGSKKTICIKNLLESVHKFFFLTILIVLILPFNKTFASQNKTQIIVIAKIDNRVITNLDLIDRYKLVLEMSKINLSGAQEKRIVLGQILQKMIDEELQIKEASTLGINLDQQKFDQAQAEVSKTLHQNPKQLISFFKHRSISYASFSRQLEAQILWSIFITASVAPKTKVSQSEINELLELRKIKSDIEKYFIAEIFIPFEYKNDGKSVDSKDLSFKLFDEFKKEKNFDNIVKQFSRSPTAEFNGEIGWIGVGDVDVRIYKAVSQTKLNEVSVPVLMDDGYYLFKVINKKTFNSLTSQDIEQVKNIVFNKKLQLMARSRMMDLRKNAYIEIDRQSLSELALSIN